MAEDFIPPRFSSSPPPLEDGFTDVDSLDSLERDTRQGFAFDLDSHTEDTEHHHSVSTKKKPVQNGVKIPSIQPFRPETLKHVGEKDCLPESRLVQEEKLRPKSDTDDGKCEQVLLFVVVFACPRILSQIIILSLFLF